MCSGPEVVRGRLLYFTPSSPDASDAPGVRSRYLVAALREAGWEVQVFAGDRDAVFRTPSNKHSAKRRLAGEALAGIEAALRLATSRADGFVLSSPSYVSVLITGGALAALRRPFVLDVRDIYPEVYFHLGLLPRDSLPGRALVKLAGGLYRRAAGIATATEGLRQIVDGYRPGTPLVAVFNGFDASLFSPSEEKRERFSLVFHGNLARMQNVELLLAVAERLPDDVDVLVAGDGPQADRLRDQSRVQYLGKVDYEDIPALVRSCHVGLSFRNDGVINETAFPVKIFEYLGAGLPVITTPHSEAGRYLEAEGLGRQFHNHELDELVEEILAWRQRRHGIEPPPSRSRQEQARAFAALVDSVIA